MYIFAAAVGLYTGGPNSIMTPISLQMVGMEYLSSAHGLERFFCGVGYFAGPPVAGERFQWLRNELDLGQCVQKAHILREVSSALSSVGLVHANLSHSDSLFITNQCRRSGPARIKDHSYL